MEVEDAIKRSERLLAEIDNIARERCHYDYGLPLHDDGDRARMVLAVAEFVGRELSGAVAETEKRLATLFASLAVPTWSATPPTAVGWYWSRPVGAQQAECVLIGESGGRLCIIYHDEEVPPDDYAKWYGGEWCGPLVPPS